MIPLITILLFITNSFKLNYISDSDALCLDGSQSSYYKAEGYGTGLKKYIIHFQGGSRIGGSTNQELLASAYSRSKTILGSSKNLSENKIFQGWFSRTKVNNPYYFNWNLIYLNYCDGTIFQGYKSQAVEYNGEQLYFKGDKIVKSFLKDLLPELQNADLVLVSGCSAGGIASYFWVQYINDLLSDNIIVYGVPDSGIFVDQDAIDGTNQVKISQSLLMKLVNEEVTHPNKKCVEANKNQLWKCYYVQYLLEYINTPLFIVQSLYDYHGLNTLLKLTCAAPYNLSYCTKEERNFADENYQNVYDIIQQKKNQDSQTGAFAISCIEHCFLLKDYYNSENWEVPGESNNTLMESLNLWLQSDKINNKNFYLDDVKWPNNKLCSNEEQNSQHTILQFIKALVLILFLF